MLGFLESRHRNNELQASTVPVEETTSNALSVLVAKCIVNTARLKAVLSAVKGNQGKIVVKASSCWLETKINKVSRPCPTETKGNPQQDLKDKGVIDSGCSRHMTGNRSYLTDYKEIN
ncbi:hypothetical protein Tco_0831956 [Tanacetum coccineum]